MVQHHETKLFRGPVEHKVSYFEDSGIKYNLY